MVVSAVLKEPDPLPTAQANELCHSDSKSFIFSLATSKTVSETRSGGVPAPLNMAVVEVHRHCLGNEYKFSEFFGNSEIRSEIPSEIPSKYSQGDFFSSERSPRGYAFSGHPECHGYNSV